MSEPRSERTEHGDQVLIADTPRRTTPAGALRAKARQGEVTDLPLFAGSDTSAQGTFEGME